jgi:segregation and condensation protein B
MTEPEPSAPEEPATPADLGRSYAQLLQQGASWELDVDPPAPMADAGAEESQAAAPTATSGAVSQAETPPSHERIIESLLFVGGAPLSAAAASEVIRGLTAEQFTQAVAALNQTYRRQGRPYIIQAQGTGFVLTLRPRFRVVTERIYGTAREARLSAVAIDVLALVAYRQPVTRQEIDSLRGADSASLLRQLVRRGLVTLQQRGEVVQHEVFYGTTPRFLELFGLGSLDDLPQTQDLQQL